MIAACYGSNYRNVYSQCARARLPSRPSKLLASSNLPRPTSTASPRCATVSHRAVGSTEVRRACESEQQHVVILVRNTGLSQLDTYNTWYAWFEIRRRVCWYAPRAVEITSLAEQRQRRLTAQRGRGSAAELRLGTRVRASPSCETSRIGDVPAGRCRYRRLPGDVSKW